MDPNSILLKHKRFIRGLEEQKQRERQDNELTQQEQDQKKKQFKDQAANQRKKIKTLKQEDVINQNDSAEPAGYEPLPKARLTEENLKKNDVLSEKKAESIKSSAKGKKQKPAWAKSEKEQEEAKENEIDELLEFAYELDYEKYMDDFEVRQAIAIIKDRVLEIKKDDDWKVNIAKEWNAAEEETGDAAEA